MKVFIVTYETSGYTPLKGVEKVFLDEDKAYEFAEEENAKNYSIYHEVVEREVEE